MVRIAFNAGRVEVSLGAQLERRDFELYEKKLKEIREQVAKKEAFKAELGGDFNPRAFNAYQRELKRTERAVDDQVKAQGRLRTAFGNVYGKGGAVFAAAGGIYAFVTAGKAAIGTASDINESLTKNQQLFGRYAKDVDKFSKQSAASFGISRKAALEYTGVFGNLARAQGFTEKGAATLSLRFTKLAADLASFNNTSIADALDALRSGIVGETEPLRRFGVALSADAVQAEAARIGLIKLDKTTADYKTAVVNVEKAERARSEALKEHGKGSIEFEDATAKLGRAQDKLGKIVHGTNAQLTPQQKILATQSIIFKQTEQAQGDFARTSGGLANQTRILQARFSDIQGEIGQKLLPVLVDVAGATNRFIGQMQSGTGAGGAFVQTMKDVAGAFGTAYGIVKKSIDGWAGFFSTIIRGEEQVARFIGLLHPGNDAFDRFATRADKAADKLDKFREHLRGPKKPADDLRDSIHRGNVTLENLSHFTDNLKFGPLQKRIDNLGGHFTDLRGTIANTINKSVATVGSGMGQIQHALNVELKNLGVSGDLKPLGGLKITGGIGVSKAGGGWIGNRGMIGQDVVPAMLAPGEAVLNRHQQAIIETLLGDGFLDQLFARVNTPHYFAKGGLAPAVSTLAGRLNSMFGLTTTSTTGGNHVPGSYHYQGLAADIAGPASSMFRASEYIKSSGTYRSLLEGIHNPNLAVQNGQIFSGAGPFGGVWANHANHIHIALRSLGVAAGGGIAGISIPRLTGGRGALGAIAQAALQHGGKAANTALQRIIGSLGGGDISGAGIKGGYGKAQLAALWRRAGGDPGVANLMAAIALAESGGNPRAHNPSGASGLWQILGLPFKGNVYNPLTNAKMAVAKYDTQGLGAWEAYTNGSYRQYLARGGRASKRKKPRVTAEQKARDYIRPLRALQSDRIDSYDIEMGRVDDLNTSYGILERTYDLSDEELIRDDGTVDEKAVQKRANELDRLALVRSNIVAAIRRAIAVARRVIKTYNTILRRLRRSLSHAKKKDRAGVKGLIGTYEGRLDEWHGILKDLTHDKLPNATLDMRELLKERREVLGTTADTQDTGGGDTGDLGGGDGGGDTGGGDTGGVDADTGAQISQLLSNLGFTVQGARINAAALAAFASPGDIGTGGRVAIEAAGGRASSGAPIAAAIDAAGQQGVTIVQNINTLHPGDPEVLRALADAATSGIGLQSSKSVSTATLGI